MATAHRPAKLPAKPTSKSATKSIGDGVIRPDELYTLTELKRRMGIRDLGWWTLRDAGLADKVVRIGNRRFVLGRHVIEVFEKLVEAGQAQNKK